MALLLSIGYVSQWLPHWLLRPNHPAHLPGHLQWRDAAQNQDGGPVTSVWFGG